jgi:glycosyltransferase involved in cell wall biosynthesis
VRICLITPGQPSTDPRLVKEADALHEAGHEVRVLCSHYVSWADEADKVLLASRPWQCTYVGGRPRSVSSTYYWTRARHALAQRALKLLPASSFLERCVLDRVAPELEAAALSTPADLYIAHYAGALPAAALAARRYGAMLGFDAEDLEFGSWHLHKGPSDYDLAVERIQACYLPECDYITASSAGIAEACAARYQLPLPATILNVFPLTYRPSKFRATAADGPLTVYWFSQTIGLDRGLPDAVRALGLLRGHRIELHIRGELRENTRRELFALAALAGVDSSQIVLHALALPEEIVRSSAQYDIGLALEQPVTESRKICLTNKIFTYLLAGNAVAATATPGQRSLMAGITGAGFCCPPGDAQALARGLLAWYQDRKALDRARRQAWDWGTREFNWELEKQKFLMVADGVLSDRPDRAGVLEPAAEAALRG